MVIGGTGWAGYGLALDGIITDNWLEYEKDGVPVREGPFFIKENYNLTNSTGGQLGKWLNGVYFEKVICVKNGVVSQAKSVHSIERQIPTLEVRFLTEL